MSTCLRIHAGRLIVGLAASVEPGPNRLRRLEDYSSASMPTSGATFAVSKGSKVGLKVTPIAGEAITNDLLERCTAFTGLPQPLWNGEQVPHPGVFPPGREGPSSPFVLFLTFRTKTQSVLWRDELPPASGGDHFGVAIGVRFEVENLHFGSATTPRSSGPSPRASASSAARSQAASWLVARPHAACNGGISPVRRIDHAGFPWRISSSLRRWRRSR